VKRRGLIGFCCLAAVGAFCLCSGNAETPSASANAPAKPAAKGTGAAATSQAANTPSASIDSARLVREVVYNEQHDHDTHGYWRYWVERHSSKETRVDEQVETPDGPITWAQSSNGRPLTAEARIDEDRRLAHLLDSSSEQAQHRKEYADDEHRIGRILALLPDAFLYEPIQEQLMPEGPCYHLRFHPNPAYPAHSIESRIFHAMSGDLWIGVESKRLVRLDGRLRENVDFGYGIFGRLYKGGWFRLERTHVSAAGSSGAGAGDWKTQRLEVHMIGRAMLFKTIARETSEVRGGFMPVPAGLSLQQAAMLVRQPDSSHGTISAQATALITAR
jgi:hypothetical protein